MNKLPYKLHFYQENLCKEIIMTPQTQLCTLGFYYAPYIPNMISPKYKFSRNWYVAEYDWVNQGEVLEWCTQQFGPHPRNPDAWSRWKNHYSEHIHFRDSKDYAWFMLRWGI